jgi:diguanylate cyclase (GGDEF)-like protein/PAS domain S-box-containing protein
MVFLITMLYYFISFTKHVECSMTIQRQVHYLHGIQANLRRLKPFEYDFINFDTINADLEKFNSNLKKLKNNLDNLSNPPSYLYDSYNQILAAHDTYQMRIEHFKSFYASTQNSLYQLHALQEAIINDNKIPSKFRLQVANIGLKILDLPRFKHDSNHIKNLHSNLQELALNSNAYDDIYTKKFLMHARAILEFIQWFDSNSVQKADIELTKSLDSFYALASSYSQKNLDFRHWVTILFFIATCALLGLIALVYHRTLLSRKALQAFKYAIENSDNTIIITSPSREIVYANSAFEKSSGYAASEVIGKNPNILKSDRHTPGFYKEMNTVLGRGKKWRGEFINRRKDGSLFYEKASIVPVFLDNKLINYLAIKLDVTDYVEQSLRLQEYATVFEHIEETIIITDTYGRIRVINRAFGAHYGYSPEFAQGKPLSKLFANPKQCKFILDKVAQSGVWGGKVNAKRNDGTSFPFWTTAKLITNSAGDAISYIVVQTDIKEVLDMQEKAEHLANHDPLTGLLNRRGFENAFTPRQKNAKNYNKFIALAFLDLDYFKPINDTYGHDVGDLLLKFVAARIIRCLRDVDILARFGGDEFVVLLDGLSSQQEATPILVRILNAFTKSFEIKGIQLRTSPSIGVAFYPSDANSYEVLIKKADTAMYSAKERGKNRFCFYS